MRRFIFLLICLSFAMFNLQGCTCCTYYNHMFNMERAWDEGHQLKANRADSTPQDTAWVNAKESAKWTRTIEKGSRILERYPDDVEYKPITLYMLGEALRLKASWKDAIIKYNEFERYFPAHDSIPSAEYQRAFCFYQLKDYPQSRFSLERILKLGKNHPWYQEGLQLLARIEEQQQQSTEAIAALESLLLLADVEPLQRAMAHKRLGELYLKEKKYPQAYDHFVAKEIAILPVNHTYSCAIYAATCLQELKKYQEALVLLQKSEENKDYSPWINVIRIQSAEVLFLNQEFENGRKKLDAVIADSSTSEHAAKSWFLLGDNSQKELKNYPQAISEYQSCSNARKVSNWAYKANIRKQSLEALLAHKTETQKEPEKFEAKKEFQIAELFLFKLEEVDSALVKLATIIAHEKTDSLMQVKAAYAQAYILDEFKENKSSSDSLYQWIIEKFPHSPQAKQAQKNLGRAITVQTKEDLAHNMLIEAEDALAKVAEAPVENMQLVDSLYHYSMKIYDSIPILFPGTLNAARALLTRANFLETNEFKPSYAKVKYEELARDYLHTPQGQLAASKLNPKMNVNEEQIEQMRKRVEKDRELRAKQLEVRNNTRKNLIAKPPKTEGEEELSTDYEDLYRFDD